MATTFEGLGCRGCSAGGRQQKQSSRYAPDLHQGLPVKYDLHLDFSHLESSAVPVVHCLLSIHFLTKNHSDGGGSLRLNAQDLVDLNVWAENPFNASTMNGRMDFTYDGRSVHIPLLPNSNLRVIYITYAIHGSRLNNASSLISGMFFGQTEQGRRYCVTDNETERARYWLPIIDFPLLRIPIRYELVCESDLVAVANGTFKGTHPMNNEPLLSSNRHLFPSTPSNNVSSNINKSFSKTVYDLEYPLKSPSYLLCLAVGPFVHITDDQPTLIRNNVLEQDPAFPLKYFALPTKEGKEQVEKELWRAFGRTPQMIRWLQKKLNYTLPWPKYYQIAAPEIRGAMENISFVTFSQRFLMDEFTFNEAGVEKREDYRTVQPGTRPFWLDTVVVHELAHTYFGDLLTCRHFEHSWLKESWATYIESQYIRDHYPRPHLDYNLLLCYQTYMNEITSDYVRPVVTNEFISSWSLFDGTLYEGGALRLWMLENLLGGETFWRGVNEFYLRQHAPQNITQMLDQPIDSASKAVLPTVMSDALESHHAGLVETTDFQKALERASGRTLTRFFENWIHGRGIPQVNCTMEPITPTTDGGESKKPAGVRITGKQSVYFGCDEDAAKDPRLKRVFPMSITIRAFFKTSTADGEKMTHVDGRLDFDQLEESSLSIHAPSAEYSVLSHVVVDPDHVHLMKLEFSPSLVYLENALKSGYQGYDRDGVRQGTVSAGSVSGVDHQDIVTRIWIYQQLIADGLYRAWSLIESHICGEVFYGVRLQVAKLLGKSQSAYALRILVKMLAAEKDDRVYAEIFKGLRVKEPLVAGALREFVNSAKFFAIPYRARAEALESLGFQADPQDMPVLQQHLSYLDSVFDSSIKCPHKHLDDHDVTRIGLYKALSHHRSLEAMETLAKYAQASHPSNLNRLDAYYGRPAAIQTLAQAAFHQLGENTNRAKSLIEYVMGVALRDPEERHRKAAIAGIVSSGCITSPFCTGLNFNQWATALEQTRESLYAVQDHVWLLQKVESIRSMSGKAASENVAGMKKRIEELETRLRKMEDVLLKDEERNQTTKPTA